MTRAVNLANIADTNLLIADSGNQRVGIGSTLPTTELDVNGTITASSFSGSATGLSGTPDITIGTLNATSGTFSGIVTAADTRIQSIGEKTTIVDGNTANLVYNTGGGNIAICTNATGNITLAVTGIPETNDFDNNSITFSVCSLNTGTARSCTAITLNGYSATIRWAGGSLLDATSGVTTSTGMDIYSFSGINTVGSASTTANYYLLGVVNGGYR